MDLKCKQNEILTVLKIRFCKTSCGKSQLLLTQQKVMWS